MGSGEAWVGEEEGGWEVKTPGWRRRSIHMKGSDGHCSHIHLGDNGAWNLCPSPQTA